MMQVIRYLYTQLIIGGIFDSTPMMSPFLFNPTRAVKATQGGSQQMGAWEMVYVCVILLMSIGFIWIFAQIIMQEIKFKKDSRDKSKSP